MVIINLSFCKRREDYKNSFAPEILAYEVYQKGGLEMKKVNIKGIRPCFLIWQQKRQEACSLSSWTARKSKIMGAVPI